MILLVHLIFGAAIGSAIKNIPVAIILAFFSHYFLDLFPHIEYDTESIKEKLWRHRLPALLRMAVDFCSGILFILIFSVSKQPIIYICAFFAILPDGISATNYFAQNKILEIHDRFHQKIHFLKYKKISNFWRILSQIASVIISILLFKI